MEGECFAAARRFITLATEGEAPSIEDLSEALDRLILAYHLTPRGDVSGDDREPPDTDHGYQLIGERFPAFGYYASVDPSETEAEAALGDAIDDIADIVRDLRDVLWYLENSGVDEAHWQFRFLFEIHWGRHARDLALYLHAKRF